MKINLIYNKFIPDYKKSLEIIEKALISYNVDFRTFNLDKMEDYGELTLVIGGDGTLLRAAKFYSAYGVPVMGINVGRLGFLAQAGVEDINCVIESLTEGKYKTEDRLMLKSGKYTALNDFVIKGCIQGRTSRFYLKINDKFVCDYIADGLIISSDISLNNPAFLHSLNADSEIFFVISENINFEIE